MHKLNLFHNVLLLILSQATVGLTASGGICPTKFKKNEKNGQCYFISKTYAGFYEAKEMCESRNSQMASVLSFDDQSLFISMLTENSLTCTRYDSCVEFWIGISDSDGNKKWTSTNGASINKENQFWANGSPSGTGRCVLLNLHASKKDPRRSWKTEDCPRPLKYVCTAPVSSVCPSPTTLPTTPSTTTSKPSKYRIIPEQMSWNEAFYRCQDFGTGASLAIITTATENQDIVEFLKSEIEKIRSACNDPHHRGSFWIGAQRENPKKCDEPFVWKGYHGKESPMEYSHWYPGQPDCGNGKEFCVHISELWKYDWNDLPCTHMTCALCQLS